MFFKFPKFFQGLQNLTLELTIPHILNSLVCLFRLVLDLFFAPDTFLSGSKMLYLPGFYNSAQIQGFWNYFTNKVELRTYYLFTRLWDICLFPVCCMIQWYQCSHVELRSQIAAGAGWKVSLFFIFPFRKTGFSICCLTKEMGSFYRVCLAKY